MGRGTSISKAEHSWDDGSITHPATCTTPGEKKYICANCSANKTEVIDPLGHDVSSEWTVDKSATCTESGSKSHHCSRCDYKADITVIEPINHAFGEWIPVDANQHKRICNNDEMHFEQEDHSWNSGVIKTNATCTEAGIRTYTCTKCGATKDEDIGVIGHKYGAWTKVNDNEHQRVCSNNPAHIEKANHTWNAGVVTTEAKCEKAGVRTYTCTVCNATKAETINALGHTSPDGNGNCSRCGKHLKDVDSGNSSPAGACKYCGQVHGGAFGWLIKFFHGILAMFGLRK